MLLVAGFLWLAAGYVSAPLAWGMLVWDALVLLAALLDGLRLPAPDALIAGRAWLASPSLAAGVPVELSVRHQAGLILNCTLVEDLPIALESIPAELQLRVWPRATATIRRVLDPSERGDFVTGPLYIRYRSLLGLVVRWAVADLQQPIRIYPELQSGEDQELFLARSRQIDLQMRLIRQRGLGREFESLREYRPGDDLRDICWTASARRGDLVTRLYQAERSQNVWIVIDTGRLLRARVRDGAGHNFSKLDYATSTAVSLAQLAQYSGDRVGLLAYGQGIQQQLLPGRGAAHSRLLIEALAQIRGETAEADHLRATAVLGRLQPRRALILWITDLAESAMQPEVIEGAAQLLRRHLVLFVTMAQPEVAAIAGHRPANVDEMFKGAAAEELASRRRLLLARLRDQGAITMDTLPDTMTVGVLNHYLEVKKNASL
jgi:uncharacterized protein (DUF58 family)